jgi:hypothetical protein
MSVHAGRSMAGYSPSLARLRERTIDAERCENVCITGSIAAGPECRFGFATVTGAWRRPGSK